MNSCIHDSEVSLSAFVFFARSHPAIFTLPVPRMQRDNYQVLKVRKRASASYSLQKAKNVYTSLVTQLEMFDDKMFSFFQPRLL